MTVDDLDEMISEALASPMDGDKTHPLVDQEELEHGSPLPIQRADPRYKDIDTQDPLYVPRYLVREWGWPRFERSAYYSLWANETEDTNDGPDPRPSQKKKR